MQRLLFLCFMLVGHWATAQESSLKKFTKARISEDSLYQSLVIRKATVKNTPTVLVDSVKKQNWLLVMEEDDRLSYRAPLNDGAAKTTGALSLINPLGSFQLTGKDINCGIWDDGLVKDHVEFGNRILSKEGSTPQSHATHVTGTILASGINALAKGMAPQASAYTYYFNNDLSEMSVAANSIQPLLFSNHSYGAITGWSLRNGVWSWYGDPAISTEEDYRHGFYSQRTKNIDALAYLSPYYTIVWAAGNDRFDAGDGSRPADCNKGTGYDCIISDAVGKNIITVGAVQKVLNYTSSASVVMSHFSSWGPTDDGRIKPDLVGAGMDVFSTSANGTNAYELSTGTSMATPNVTGSLMLLQELYAKLHAGKFMRAATLKGLAIHTAKEAGPKPGPDYQFGWGLLDVKAGADFLIAENNIDRVLIEERLASNQSYELEIQPQVNKKVTVTLCWTDPEGNPVNASLDPLDKMLVNDLDLRLIDEDGLVTLPWSLNPSVPQAQAIQADNSRDNIEKIELLTPLNKTYKIVVRHKGELQNGYQDFSVIISYTSKSADSKTFYWIGNTGDWSDTNNWSLTSGGLASNLLPGNSDIVIIDQLSMDREDTIRLSSTANIAQIKWLCNKKAFLDLGNHELVISKNLTFTSDSTKLIGGGALNFATVQEGIIHFANSDLSDTDINFQAGDWFVDGSFKTNHITIQRGNHTWGMKTADLKSMDVLNTSTLNVSGVKLMLHQEMNFALSASLEATGSVLLVEHPSTEIVLAGNDFDGEIRVVSENNRLKGEGRIQKLVCTGDFVSEGSLTFKSIELQNGASWTLANSSLQQIDNLIVSTPISQPCLIQSETSATINFSEHRKICLENLIVKNVNATGQAAVNVGTSSQLENASNWLAMPCDEVLFADFNTAFTCAKGLSEFRDASQGDPSSWQWTFTDEENNTETSDLKNATASFENVGLLTASLTISKDQQSHTYSKTISIVDNPLPQNEILVNLSGSLVSLVMSDHYQWYHNRQVIENASFRELTANQLPGLYEVLIENEVCNRLSAPYLISEVPESLEIANIYPNPASQYFFYSVDEAKPVNVYLYNNLGQLVKTVALTTPVWVNDLPNGIYIVKIVQSDGKAVLQKLIVAH